MEVAISLRVRKYFQFLITALVGVVLTAHLSGCTSANTVHTNSTQKNIYIHGDLIDALAHAPEQAVDSANFLYVQYPTSNRCLTPSFWCLLPGYAQVGSPCWCGTTYGPVAGRVG
jgi:hypothetical protein